MLLHCYAVVPKSEEREKLTSNLRHHNLPFVENGCRVSIDAHFLSYRSIERIMSYFEDIESDERGFTVIGDNKEVPYDTG